MNRKIFKSIFIDGSFLFHCVQNLGVRIDYKKLKNLFLTSNDHLVSASYYTALPNEGDMDDRHKSFIKILKKEVRVRVRSVPLLRGPEIDKSIPSPFPVNSPRYSKGEDILLACDMVKGAYTGQYDVAILVTGDGDFVPAVRMVQDAGKPVIVASFHSSLSQYLDMEASDVIYLDEYLDKIRLIESNN